VHGPSVFELLNLSAAEAGVKAGRAESLTWNFDLAEGTKEPPAVIAGAHGAIPGMIKATGLGVTAQPLDDSAGP